MDPKDSNVGGEEVWEGLEDLLTLPKQIDQEHVSVALGVYNHVHEVSEVDQQNQDHFDWYYSGNEEEEDTSEYRSGSPSIVPQRQLQFQQDFKNQENFITCQENGMLGSVADSANKMESKASQSTSYGSSPIERKRKEQGKAKKRKQSSVPSTSNRRGQGKKLTPVEEWANSLFNEDEFGRIDVEVERLQRRKFDVKVASELSTIAEVKRAISSYILTTSGDYVGVERMVLSMVDSAEVEVMCDDHLTLREMNTLKVKLRVLPQ